jgi:hypothetical protein
MAVRSEAIGLWDLDIRPQLGTTIPHFAPQPIAASLARVVDAVVVVWVFPDGKCPLKLVMDHPGMLEELMNGQIRNRKKKIRKIFLYGYDGIFTLGPMTPH